MSRKLPTLLLLTLLLLFSLAGSVSAESFAGGTGAPEDPYLINTPAALDQVRSNLAASYILTADLDLTDYISATYPDVGWLPIGNWAAPFNGSFDGDGHTITGLKITMPTETYIGLFGCAGTDSVLQDLTLSGVEVSGKYDVGALAGESAGEVTNCSAAGTVSGVDIVGALVGYSEGSITGSYASGTVSGVYDVGGLVGLIYGSVTDSYATCTVSGYFGVGGLVGGSYGEITGSYATGTVSGEASVGGLVGVVDGVSVTNSYATGTVTGTGDAGAGVGGLVGYLYRGNLDRTWASGAVNNTGADRGGLVGLKAGGAVTKSYYDSQTSGQTDTGKGEPKTTVEMQSIAAYVGWDFTAGDGNPAVWGIAPAVNGGYPYLRWQEAPAVFAGGTGTAVTPYQITTPAQLDLVRSDLGASYILTADIDLTAYIAATYGAKGWLPIGNSWDLSFNGSFDGDGHTITGLMINRPTEEDVGFFGCTGSTSVLKDLTLSGVDVSGGTCVGALAGKSFGEVTNCGAAGTVSGGEYYVGGLVGFSMSTISGSYASCTVSGSGYFVGGLVGYLYFGSVTGSYATGTVSGVEEVGGLVGMLDGCFVTECYATGTVSGIYNVGGLVGSHYGLPATNSYYDSDTSGQTDTGKGEPKTTAEMQSIATYVGWDFTAGDGNPAVWGIAPAVNGGYPYLRWQGYAVSAAAEFGVVTGTGIYNDGDTVTLSADPDDGYTFTGWYDEEDTLLYSRPLWTFTASADFCPEAHFAPMPQSELRVTTLPGGTVSLGESPLGDDYTAGHPQSTAITLNAVPDTGYTFAWWADADTNSIITTNLEYSVSIGRGVNLKAVFSKTPVSEDAAFTVVFRDRSGRVLKSTLVNKGDTAEAPAAPGLIGYTFAGWDQALTDVQSERLLTARYTRFPSTYSVTVENGTLDTGGTEAAYRFDTPVTVVANAAPVGEQFSHWERDDMKVSYEEIYQFHTLMADTVLTACYVAEAEAVSPEPFITLYPALIDPANHALMFVASRAVPVGYTLVESGIILLQAESSPDNLDLDTAGSKIGKVGSNSTDQFIVRKLGAVPLETWYARAYLLYLDGAGNLMTVYSTDTVSAMLGGS